IEWRQSIRDAIRPGHGVLDREAHIRITQLRQRGTVYELDHRMNNTLRVYHHFHTLHLDAEEPVCLDHFQAFVEQGRGIDRDFWPHVPRRMFQSLFGCDRIEILAGRFPKWTARGSENDAADI